MSRYDADYIMIEQAAIKGERCPQDQPHGPLRPGAIGALARAGKVRSEVFKHNWRVVTILEGEHKGRQTAPAPGADTRPYSVTDKNGTRVNGRAQVRYGGGPARLGPSAPRDYTNIFGLRDLKEDKR